MFGIDFDPAKRDQALKRHGVDFMDTVEVFEGETYQRRDDRKDYREIRTVIFGFLRGRMFVVVWNQRGLFRRVISMRKANEREQSSFGQ